jgi:hypothetical protein
MRLINHLVATTLIMLLTACGGGGGGDGGSVGVDVVTYTVGGSVSGLTGTLVLRNNGGDALTRSSNGSFTFATPINDGASYSVTVASQPAGQSCSVSSGSGTVSGGNVTSITVSCVDTGVASYTVGGTLSGLTGSVVLRNNGGDALTRSSNGGFTFATPINDGASYSVTVASQPAGQSCSVSSGSGTVSGGNVTSITVSCVDTGVASYTVGGTLSGLTGSVVLRNNGGDALTRSSNGGFTFASPINDGASYSVTVASQPSGQNCSVTNGSGTVSGGNVTSVTVSCVDSAPTSYTVGGTLSGLTGSVVLRNNGGDALTRSSNGGFTFATPINDGASYSVTVASQPSGQNCSVTNGSGTVSGGNVTSVTVSCVDSAPASYTVGGTLSGLNGSVTLQNNGGDDLALINNGSFTFNTGVLAGDSYSVTVKSQPAGQSCAVTNGSGTASSNVTSVAVTCAGSNIALTNMGIKTQSPSIVVMPIHARDKGTGLSVRGLNTADFLVKEDSTTIGVESYVTSKPVGEVPYVFRIVVAVDVSSSITLVDIEQEKTALLGVVNNLQPNQQLAIYTFDDVVTLRQGFTSDKTALGAAISTITRGSPSTNLYGAISTGASQWTDSFNLTNVTYGALLVITDGDDTSGLVTKATAQTAVLNKQAYIIPVGAAVEPGTAGYQNMVDIFGAERVISSSDFSVLTNTLDTIRSNLLETFAGLYYVYYASPSRSGTHTIDLSVVGNGNTASDSHVIDSFSAAGFTSVIPQVLITGPDAVYVDEPVIWSVETLWSNDPPNYTWGSNATTGQLLVSPDLTSATLTGLSNSLLGTVNVTVTDNNWAKSTTKALTINASRAPASVTANNSGYQENTLSWSAVTDATGYKVYWNTTSGVTTASNQFAVTANSTTHTGLPSGLTYYYRIATQFGGQESGLSAEVSAAVVVPTVTNVNIVSTPTQNDLSWNAVGTASYRIYWNTTGSPTTSDPYIAVASGVTSYSHAGLDSAASYYYTVVAVDGGVTGTPSLITDNVFVVSGSVTGLVGSGLTMQNNGADNLLVTGSSFSFPTEVTGSYSVTILAQPDGQTCNVSNGSGVAASDASDITNVVVTCLNNYTVGGSVTGLTGAGLVLQNNGGDDLIRSNNGAFVFAATLPLTNTAYSVTIKTQPAGQSCSVANGVGTAIGNVSNISVDCLGLYTIGGTVSGLTGNGLVLQNNAGNDYVISADGGYVFSGTVLEGSAYNVSILSQPTGQLCSVSNDTGVVSGDVTNASVTCVDYFSVAVTVTGLLKNGLVLQNNGGDDLAISVDGDFIFSQQLPPGEAYNVSVLSQPNGPGQSCVVSNGAGSSTVNVSNIAVDCTSYTPILTLNLGVKQLQFSWPSHPDVTHYQLMENPDGVSGYSQVGGNITTTNAAVYISVHRHDWANASYMLLACSSTGCVDSNVVFTAGGVLNAIGYFKSSNPDANDLFASIAISADGTTLAVGASGEASNATGINGVQADNSLGYAGAAYVYSYGGGVWVQQAYIKASNTGASDGFGKTLALSSDGNTLAVGAPYEDSNATGVNGDQANNSVSAAGAVYIFNRSGVTWTQQAYIKASNPDVDDNFGKSLSLSGDGATLAVGADQEGSIATGINGSQTDNSLANSGAVYVFSYDGVNWAQQAYIKASIAQQNLFFGSATSLSSNGSTLAVGAYQATFDGGVTYPGGVYVYTRSGGIWTEEALIGASNGNSGDRFGVHVLISGDGGTLAVAAPDEDSNATGVNGNQADNSASSAGAVYIFNRSGGAWAQQAYIKASNTDANDQFSFSMALSSDGSTLAVSSRLEASSATGINGDQADNTTAGAGAVYLYVYNGSGWSQQAYIKASNTAFADYFGADYGNNIGAPFIGLSADGSALAVGATGEDGSTSGIGGDQADNTKSYSGAVYLY